MDRRRSIGKEKKRRMSLAIGRGIEEEMVVLVEEEEEPIVPN